MPDRLSEPCRGLLALLRGDRPAGQFVRSGDDTVGGMAIAHEAGHQGVSALLYAVLRTRPGESPLDAETLGFLRDEYLNSSLNNLKIYSALERATARLAEQGIDVLLLKGAHLARFVYRYEAARSMVDADVMVRSGDFGRSVGVLQAAGFSVHAEPQTTREPGSPVDHVALASRTGAVIEIHRTLDLSRPESPVDLTGVWERSVPVDLGTTRVWVLSPEDAVLHLCMHASMQHGFGLGLAVVCDIDAILHQGGAFDWTILAARAAEWRMTRGAWLTLSLCRDLMGVAIPADILSSLRPLTSHEPMLDAARTRLLAGKPRDAISWSMLQRLVGPPAAGRHRLKGMVRQSFPPPAEVARRFGVTPGSWRIPVCYARRIAGLTRTYAPLLWWMLTGQRGVRTAAQTVRDEASLKRWLRSE